MVGTDATNEIRFEPNINGTFLRVLFGAFDPVLPAAVLVGLRAFSVMLEWRELFRRPLATLVKPGYMLHGGIAGGTGQVG